MQSLRVMEYYLDESASVEYTSGEAVTKIIGDQAGDLFKLLQVLCTCQDIICFFNTSIVSTHISSSRVGTSIESDVK